MEKLPRKSFNKVRTLFGELDYLLIITAVIDQSSPGEIYVDDVELPTAALMISPEGNFLVGDHENESFNAKLKPLLVDIMDEDDDLEIQYAPVEWANRVSELFQIEYPLIFSASYYLLSNLTSPKLPPLPPGWTLHTVNQAFLNREDIENLEIVRKKIDENWVNRETFFDRGFGICLLHDNKLVSECLADCVSGTQCEIGISTDSGYQRQGFASIAVAAIIAHCKARGLTSIGWHCANNNIGSIKTAEKAGFEKQRTYPIFEVIPDSFQNLCANGAHSIFQKHWHEAVELFEKAYSLQEIPSRYSYMVAAAYAMTEDNKHAKLYLEQTLKDGKTTLSQIKADARFTSFCATTNWENLYDVLDEIDIA